MLERYSTPGAWLVVTVLSIALGLTMASSAALATLIQLGTLALAITVPALARKPDAAVGIIAYAAMSDVLWRSSSAGGPYEGAKYAVIVGFTILTIRFVGNPQFKGLSLMLIALLVPGAVKGLVTLGPATAREYLSANLAGLVALAAALTFCANLRLSTREMRGLFLLSLSPIIGMCAQATTSTMSSDLTFTDSANFAASGGFGPNQVSSILCLGGLLCILVVLQRDVGWQLRILALATGVWLVGQAVLTFSRGGLFTLVLASACIALVALTINGQRARVLIVAVVLLVIAAQVLAWTGAFTDGASEDRLSSTDSSNRAEIASGDLRLFGDNPLLGVGVGQAKYQRDFIVQSAPHNEYSRLLAEHGLFGLGAILVLAAICWRIVRDSGGWYRMAAVGFIITGLAQMTHSATRLASIAIIFGLAAIRGVEP